MSGTLSKIILLGGHRPFLLSEWILILQDLAIKNSSLMLSESFGSLGKLFFSIVFLKFFKDAAKLRFVTIRKDAAGDQKNTKSSDLKCGKIRPKKILKGDRISSGFIEITSNAIKKYSRQRSKFADKKN